MPGQPRLDREGSLHHVMARGIEGSPIFRDDADREGFLERPGAPVARSHTEVYAFALTPNRFHLFLRSPPEGLPRLMRRLLTGYAVHFNHRHHRSGRLFQNRDKSVAAEEDPCFVELIRCVLNARVVSSLREPDFHRWSGRRYLIGAQPAFFNGSQIQRRAS